MEDCLAVELNDLGPFTLFLVLLTAFTLLLLTVLVRSIMCFTGEFRLVFGLLVYLQLKCYLICLWDLAPFQTLQGSVLTSTRCLGF